METVRPNTRIHIRHPSDIGRRGTHLQPDEPTDLELLAKLQTSESILGSRILRKYKEGD